MSRYTAKKIAFVLASGSICFAVLGCFQVFSAVASGITAGGVLYLVRRVID